MKKLLALSFCLATIAVLCHAQSADAGFQPAKVVVFERVAADAQHMENQDNYKISMRLGDTIYHCHASGSAATFNDWTINKELPARVNGKILQVKNFDGQMVEMNIVGKKTAK